ncbi:hypothetical protein I79_015295 [Cricetulus griseus]|uniref:Uncharacterized protein n=1 Tax=Cricetulus griseus TaxID=10029 RepID=G3HWD8_CRIGR|nr:hypothetical protein I79_015295 [Cricetulus griseus]
MKFWVSKRKILYKQFKINCNNKQHFSGSCSESKNASSVCRERVQVENTTQFLVFMNTVTITTRRDCRNDLEAVKGGTTNNGALLHREDCDAS